MSSTEYLRMMMASGAPAGTRWVSCGERQPASSGQYKVIRRKGGHYDYDLYHWNGFYWVTRGNSPTQAVEAWLEIIPS